MADEPKRLKSLKEILSIFKPEGFDKLMLKLKKGKQLGEQKLATNDFNKMMLLESYFKNMDEGFVDYTDEDIERALSKMDSLNTEISKTDSLINLIDQDKNIETDSSKVVEDFFEGMVGSTKAKTLMNVSGKLGLGKGGTKGLAELLKQSDIDMLNTTFGKRNFFNTLRGLKEGLIDPNSNAYERALRYQKLYDKFF
jgi:hypothetical protein